MKRTFNLSLVTKHWQLKLLSLLIGASLWYFVAGEDRLDLTMTIPLELRNLPANLVIANQYRKDIEVVLSGSRRLLQEMRQQNISRPVDLAKAEVGALVVKNDAESIPLPRGITVQRVQPANITLLIDRLVRKDFTITPVTKGKPAAGFGLESLTLNPPHISVSGPQTVLEKETALTTAVINLEGLDTSTTFQVHLNLNEALLKLIGETVIEASVNLKETMVRRTVRAIPVNGGEPGAGTRFSPPTVTVEAEIPERLVQKTPELAALFWATVAIPRNNSGQEMPVTVQAINPPGHAAIVVYSITPDTVRLVP